jgi:signal peptidase I
MNSIATEFKENREKALRGSSKDSFRSLAWMIGVSLVLSFLMLTFIFRTYTVNGSSMYPTLHNTDRVVVNKFVKTKSGKDYVPKRGQIIVFDSKLEGKSLIKRVIALPGEKISMTKGRFTVKNNQYPEGFDPDSSYESTLPKDDLTTFNEMEVPEGSLFVSGDNRSPGQSLDSRNQLGFVAISEVVGSAWARYWPLDDARRF